MPQRNSYNVTLCTADTIVRTGTGVLHTATFMCNDAAPTAGSIDIYDGTTAGGTKIYSETFTTTAFRAYSVVLDAAVTTGIFVDFTTTADVNVTVSHG